MEREKLNLLSHVFVELTDEKQSGILEMSKSLLQAQRHSKALIRDGANREFTGDACLIDTKVGRRP
jgi:hypothetical protein